MALAVTPLGDPEATTLVAPTSLPPSPPKPLPAMEPWPRRQKRRTSSASPEVSPPYPTVLCMTRPASTREAPGLTRVRAREHSH